MDWKITATIFLSGKTSSYHLFLSINVNNCASSENILSLNLITVTTPSSAVSSCNMLEV